MKINTLCSKKSFVIDNVNLGGKLSELVNYIKDYGYYVIGVRINTPLQVCIKRRPEIPINVLRDMYKKLNQINPRIFNKFIDYDNTKN